MDNSGDTERVIVLMAELANGDGYIFTTEVAQRAVKKFEEWSREFGAERVRGNEGFDQLARPLLAKPNQHPAKKD